MYYNVNTKAFIHLPDLCALLHASIPKDTERVGEWYLVHETERPAITETQRAAEGPVAMQNGICVRTWIVENIPASEIAEQQAQERTRLAEERAQERARRAEEQRVPDLEDAVAELGMVVDETTTENADAIIELAGYAASLEERIAALEGKE